MTTSDIERLVITALQEHAEDAMSSTDTEAGLERLVERTGRDSRVRRGAWAAGGLVAAAAVAVAVVWWPQANRPDTSPAVPEEPITEAEQVATDFVEAYLAFDRPLVTSYLADDPDVNIGGPTDVEGLLRGNRWEEATSHQGELEGCAEESRAANGTVVWCGVSGHALQSERLGRGPFGGQVIEVRVLDGEIASFELHTAIQSSGFEDQMATPFNEWLATAHPDDQRILGAWEDPDATAAEVNRSLRLWERVVQEYADAVLAGDAE